jgi:hypothetical protein
VFKKITAVLAAVLLGVGISVVSVAAPATAHTPSHNVSCNSLSVNFTSYETKAGDPTPNKLTVTIDGVPTVVNFGTSYSKSFSLEGSTSHTWSIVLDAIGGSGPNTQYDWSRSGVTTPCSYPDAEVQMTCGAATSVTGKALTNGNHINMEVEINGVKKTLSAYVDKNIPGGWTGGGWNGAGLRFTDINGVQSTVPLTEQQILSGSFTFPYGDYIGGATSYKVVWAQMQSLYFNKTKDVAKYLVCGPQTTPVTVQAVPSATQPTCDAAGALVVPTQAGIVWSGGKNGDGPGSYTLIASAADGYTLTGQTSFPVTVLPKKSGVECAPPCIPNSAVSYTYDPETNSGNIHVENVEGSSGELCTSFWVTATSWKFIEGDKQWSQVRDIVQYLPKISTPGDYPYSAPVDCGQGDIYASFTESPQPPKYLHGPNNPWQEHFLHQMGFTGPNPTYTVDSPGCNIVVPAEPTATVIDECNEYGSVQVPIDSAAFKYTVVGGPTEGKVTVTATVQEGYVVQEGAKTVFEFDLGTFWECPEKVVPGDPIATPQLCEAGVLKTGGIWVEQFPGKLEYTITGGTLTEPLLVTAVDGYTELPPGTYLVTVVALDGFELEGDDEWPYEIEVLESTGCETIAIPVSTQQQMACVQGRALGTYTLPSTEFVEWYVNGVLKTTPSDVFFPADVVVEARITDAGKAAGVFFTDGTQSKTVTHTFTMPAEDCTTTHALLTPAASQNTGSCTADPTFTLSNTPSEAGGVQWKLGNPGVNTTPGVHKAEWGSTVIATATLVNPVLDGFAPETQTAWTFKFPAKPACGDLVTLALTGLSTGGFVPWMAGGSLLLLLGGAALYFRRRLVTATK